MILIKVVWKAGPGAKSGPLKYKSVCTLCPLFDLVIYMLDTNNRVALTQLQSHIYGGTANW